MKKAFLLSLFCVLSLTLSGCGKAPLMDELDASSKVYHFKSESMGFKVDLPESFQYYQVQQKIGKNEKGEQTTDFRDMEFLIPAKDRAFNDLRNTDVPGYAKVFIVRVYEKGKYKDQGFEKLIEAKDKTYAIKFWTNLPSEWQNVWTSKDENNIKQSLMTLE
ncbi:MAG: hypothetical protein WCG01_01010 [bacterium]